MIAAKLGLGSKKLFIPIWQLKPPIPIQQPDVLPPAPFCAGPPSVSEWSGYPPIGFRPPFRVLEFVLGDHELHLEAVALRFGAILGE
jgi:hypothetical protein